MSDINVYLSNLAVWMVKLHNLHWNVTGHAFVQVHEYTESLYNDAFEQYDAVAELLKMHGKSPLVKMSDYLANATIEELDAREFTASEVLEIVEADMVKMKELATKIRNKAAEKDCFYTQGLFEGYLQDYAKKLWFLHSMMNKPAASCCHRA